MRNIIRLVDAAWEHVRIFFVQCCLFQSRDNLDKLFGVLMWACIALLTFSLLGLINSIKL